MNMLARLAEAAFAKDAPIRLNARALGFVIFAFSALYCLGIPFELVRIGGTGFDALGQILIAVTFGLLTWAIG